MLRKWPKTAKICKKIAKKLPKISFKHLKYALLLNTILRPFKNNSNHTKKPKTPKNIQNTAKMGKKMKKMAKNGLKRHSNL